MPANNLRYPGVSTSCFESRLPALDLLESRLSRFIGDSIRGGALRILLGSGDLLKDLKFAVFDNQYNRVVNGIAKRIKRELTQNRIKICDVR